MSMREALRGLVEAVTAEVNEKGAGGYLLARLSDARAALSAPDWLPIPEEIDTTKPPFDGGPVHLLSIKSGAQRIACWLTSVEEGDSAFVYARQVGSEPIAFVIRDATHYRLLPTPPTSKHGGK